MPTISELERDTQAKAAELAALERELAAFTRPAVDFVGTLKARLRGRTDSGLDAARKWDADNPEAAKRRQDVLQRMAVVEGSLESVRSTLARLRALPGILKDSGAPSRAVDAWAAGLGDTPALDAVRRFMGGDGVVLLMAGAAGAGKTVAAVEAMAQWPGGAVFVRAVEASRIGMFDVDGLNRLRRARLLVLDDLGAEMLHDGWRPTLDDLIDYRYGESLKTIITTNLDAPSFRERYGERIASRIRQVGAFAKCGDTDLRRVAR